VDLRESAITVEDVSRRLLSIAVIAVLAVAGVAVWRVAASDSTVPTPGGAGWTCNRTAASDAALRSEFAAAKPGQTICLAAGRYGTFRAGMKPGPVAVRARPGDVASIELELDPAVNVRFEGLTVRTAFVGGESRNVTIARSRFTGLAAINVDRMADANIVFEHNTHADIDTCETCRQGRVHVEGDSGSPSGVVIRDSVFSGGNSDGVRADANGVSIVGNEFTGIREEGSFHTDPIQIYGGTHVVIRGNFFRGNHVAAPIMMADGGAANVVEDNVVAPGGYTWAMVWYSDDGSVVRHNTFADGECENEVRCGVVNVGEKDGAPAGRGTVFSDNVLGGIGSETGSGFTADHNVTREPLPGDANVTGVPAYAGPPTAYRGFRLAPGSLGRRDASDGSDRGARITSNGGASQG
jgi:Right handed beta helix region